MTRDDLLVKEANDGWSSLPRDHAQWIGEMIEIVRTSLTVRNCESRKAHSSTSTSNSLGVVKRFRWHIAQKYCIQIAQINSKLKCRRTTQHMNPSVLELTLVFPCLFIVELGCVFF